MLPSSPAPESGALEAFICDFHQFENDHALFTSCVDPDGYFWWDLARYAVQFEICSQRNIVGRSAAGSEPWLSRLPRLAIKLADFVLDTSKVVTMKDVDANHLFVSGRTLPALDRGRRENTGPIFNIAAGGDLNKRNIDRLVTIKARHQVVPSLVSDQISQISQNLQQQFGVASDFVNLMERKYRFHLASIRVWTPILDRLGGLTSLSFVNDDTLRSLVSLAKARGIHTREYQHGYAGKSHIAYSYPELDYPLPTLPDELVVTRDTGDITLPVTLTHQYVDSSPSDPPAAAASRDIDVLIGGSPTRNEMALELATALIDNGLKIAVKLHPAQTISSSGFRTYFDNQQLAVYDGAEDFITLARRSKVYLPANPTSTTVYEAVENGAQLVLVDFGGQKVTTTIDSLVSARTDTPSKLVPVLQALWSRESSAP